MPITAGDDCIDPRDGDERYSSTAWDPWCTMNMGHDEHGARCDRMETMFANTIRCGRSSGKRGINPAGLPDLKSVFEVNRMKVSQIVVGTVVQPAGILNPGDLGGSFQRFRLRAGKFWR